jgi:thiol-disulfide isomerase/thioredoxin
VGAAGDRGAGGGERHPAAATNRRQSGKTRTREPDCLSHGTTCQVYPSVREGPLSPFWPRLTPFAAAVTVSLAASVLPACSSGPPPVPVAATASPPSTTAPSEVASGAVSTSAQPETAERAPDDDQGPAWLGVELTKAPPGEAGVIVRDVLRGSPAERAGVQTGDRILRVGSTPVTQPPEVVHAVSLHRAGERVGLSLLRSGAERLLPVLLSSRPDPDELLKAAFLGAPAPAWRPLATVRGSVPGSLADLRGKVVIIDFWASWCMPCRMSVPSLNAWHDRYGAQGLVVIGVTMDAPDVALQASLDMGIDYAVASDPDGETTRVFKAFALPTLFVIDREGKVRDAMVGYSSDGLRKAERAVQALVSAPL